MKTKNSLKTKIVFYFVVITFCVSIVNSVIDAFFERILPVYFFGIGKDGVFIDPVGILFIMICLAVFIAGGIVFYYLTNKAIIKDNELKMKKQNLVYATIAHDIKTPVTSVQGFARALLDGKIESEEYEDIYKIIYQKSKYMNELLDVLADYAKLGTAEYKMHKEKLDLTVLIRDIVAVYYCDLEEHNIKVELDIPEKEIEIYGDKQELKRAFTNLIVNLYKHNPDGIKAKIGVKEEGKTVEIIIADTGTELSKNMDLFEPFVTENTARTAGQGSGLGLAITKSIIEHHNGRIYVSDEIEGYTKGFVVKIYSTN